MRSKSKNGNARRVKRYTRRWNNGEVVSTVVRVDNDLPPSSTPLHGEAAVNLERQREVIVKEILRQCDIEIPEHGTLAELEALLPLPYRKALTEGERETAKVLKTAEPHAKPPRGSAKGRKRGD